jgi:hypothetical protein
LTLQLRIGSSFPNSQICGWRAGASDISELRSELEQINPKIMLMSARMDGGAINLGPLLS